MRLELKVVHSVAAGWSVAVCQGQPLHVPFNGQISIRRVSMCVSVCINLDCNLKLARQLLQRVVHQRILSAAICLSIASLMLGRILVNVSCSDIDGSDRGRGGTFPFSHGKCIVVVWYLTPRRARTSWYSGLGGRSFDTNAFLLSLCVQPLSTVSRYISHGEPFCVAEEASSPVALKAARGAC